MATYVQPVIHADWHEVIVIVKRRVDTVDVLFVVHELEPIEFYPLQLQGILYLVGQGIDHISRGLSVMAVDQYL
jgi:hypothetical protein